MKVLLLSGMGIVWPTANAYNDNDMLEDTFLDYKEKGIYHPGVNKILNIHSFQYFDGIEYKQLFRARLEGEPHLTTMTLCSILENANIEYEHVSTEDIWKDEQFRNYGKPDIVALSTTYIWNERDFAIAIDWISKHFMDSYVVLGGQYSNIKYKYLMNKYKRIDFVIRGDGELALPMLIKTIEKREDITKVPNIVFRKRDDTLYENVFEYIDMNEYPSLKYIGKHSLMPYESMRGCAFNCKFCSYPMASPKWRYKSAQKIYNDWKCYKEENDVKLIRAMDSAFTFPQKRLKELLGILPKLGVKWEAYSRANAINNIEIVEQLEASNCNILSIGFESLSNNTLKYMNKLETAEENYRTYDLLVHSKVDFRGSFIVGFPGETEEDFMLTKKFLLNDYSRHFQLNVFSLTDETMPIWQEADKYNLIVDDKERPTYWKHCGMDINKAQRLQQETIKEARWTSEKAVAVEWQIEYQLPLNPVLDNISNYRIEKLIDRLAFAPVDFHNNPAKCKQVSEDILRELESFGVRINA